jgi:hypothetical protein
MHAQNKQNSTCFDIVFSSFKVTKHGAHQTWCSDRFRIEKQCVPTFRSKTLHYSCLAIKARVATLSYYMLLINTKHAGRSSISGFVQTSGARDLQTLWSPPVSLNQEGHTFFLFFFKHFCFENSLKSPPWKHTWWSELLFFFIFIFMCFLFLFCVYFSLLYFCLFGCKFEVWRKNTHLILFQVRFFFIIISFIFSYFSKKKR